jgi:hypothetical protein
VCGRVWGSRVDICHYEVDAFARCLDQNPLSYFADQSSPSLSSAFEYRRDEVDGQMVVEQFEASQSHKFAGHGQLAHTGWTI